MAKTRPVAFIEEPGVVERPQALFRERNDDGVTVVVPLVEAGASDDERRMRERRTLEVILARKAFAGAYLWYYTPMALRFSSHVDTIRIYDCMDELSLFKNAPPALIANERHLLAMTDVVFCGGRSLYHAKRRMHKNVHCFPSSVDGAHFAGAGRAEPADMRSLRRPRIGFYGVIDERFDRAYVGRLAELLPEWEHIYLGPVVKIDPAELPVAPNLHYLGNKSYDELPAYLEYWDVALLPFALNDSTRFISPTKTLEYLAAGKPVISTPIADVVDPYGKDGLVAIAPSPDEAAEIARGLLRTPPSEDWRRRASAVLAETSWDRTVTRMAQYLPAHADQELVVG